MLKITLTERLQKPPQKPSLFGRKHLKQESPPHTHTPRIPCEKAWWNETELYLGGTLGLA